MFALAAAQRRSCPQPRMFVFRSRKGGRIACRAGDPGRPENRVGNPEPASGSGEISGLSTPRPGVFVQYESGRRTWEVCEWKGGGGRC